MSWVAARIGQAVVVIAVAFTATFLLLQALPGDAIAARYEATELGLSPAQIAEIRAALGADEPIWVQYIHSVGGFLTGELGTSLQTGAAVSTLIASALPHTLVLALAGLAAAVVLASVVSVLATFGGWSWLRRLMRSVPPLLVSLPVFWVGIVLIQVVSFQLGLVSVIDPTPLEALILPVATIAVPIAAPLAQVLIGSIDAVRAEPYIGVATARGAGPWWLLTREVARNAVLPAITLAGVLFGELVAGAVVTEAVFGRAGLGTLTQEAVAYRDIPVLQAIVVIAAVAFVLINLAVDLLYPVLDPRLRRVVRSRRAVIA